MARPSLEEIVDAVRRDMDRRRREKTLRQQMTLAAKRTRHRDFGRAVRREQGMGIRWIGEVKRASPSAGALRADLDAVKIATLYAKRGAAAVSVLTESKYFQGSVEDLQQVSRDVPLPVLRKDFTVDEYQIVEAAASGADAVLLIAAISQGKELRRFLKTAAENNLCSLVEVHNREELDKALDAGAEVLGINNRNLKSLEVDLGVTETLCGQVPKDKTLISESGFKDRAQVEKVSALGVSAILIGETLMRSPDISESIRELFGGGG